MSENTSKNGVSRRDFLVRGATIAAAAAVPAALVATRADAATAPAQSTTASNQKRGGVWTAEESALVLIDYQRSVIDLVFEQDRRLVELNVRTLARAAVDFKIPVVLSTVGVEMGANTPTIASLTALLPNVKHIDRSSQNAWEDRAFVDAVKATGRKKLVMGGILTSVCLAFAAVSALADGYEVMFIEDAVADQYKSIHDTAISRLAHAGAVPNTTLPLLAEWFRDWKSPLADAARKIFVPYAEQKAALIRAPEKYQPRGLTPAGKR